MIFARQRSDFINVYIYGGLGHTFTQKIIIGNSSTLYANTLLFKYWCSSQNMAHRPTILSVLTVTFYRHYFKCPWISARRPCWLALSVKVHVMIITLDALFADLLSLMVLRIIQAREKTQSFFLITLFVTACTCKLNDGLVITDIIVGVSL